MAHSSYPTWVIIDGRNNLQLTNITFISKYQAERHIQMMWSRLYAGRPDYRKEQLENARAISRG